MAKLTIRMHSRFLHISWRKLAAFLSLPALAIAQPAATGPKGIEFYHGSFREALELAAKEQKLVFIDAYTTWCGPCRRMAANVFPDEAVGEFYNASFVNMKIDMEKGEGPDIARQYGVRSYPTFLFIGSDGKVVHSAGGARPSEAFIELGREALKKQDRSADWAKRYEAGERDAATVLAYIKALNLVGKPSLRVANEYLTSQNDLTTPENLEIILEATTEADSRVFDLLVGNEKAIVASIGRERFEFKVVQACRKTLRKACEYRNESLLREAQEKMKHVPKQQKAFEFTSSLEFYGETNQPEQFNKSAKTYADKVIRKDPAALKDLGQLCIKYFRDDRGSRDLAEKTARQAYALSQAQPYCIHYARMLQHNDKKGEAIELVRKGIAHARAQGEPTEMLDYLLRDWGVSP